MAPAVIAALLGLLGTGAGIGAQFLGRRKLTGAQNQQNAWNAEEAEKQRAFEEEMRNTSFQAQVKDMQAAGVNPALMYGGTGASGASVPSGAAASGTGDGMQLDPSGMISSIMELALLGAQKENIEADTEQKKAGAERDKAETERTKMLTPLEASDLAASVDLKGSQMSKLEAETAIDYANVALLETDLKTREQFNEVNLKLAEANAAKSEAERDKILQETENLKRDFAISFVQEAVLKAQTGMLSQQTKNLLVENGVLKWNEKQAEYEAGLTEYNYNHADGNRVWDRVATGASVFRDAGIGVGAVVGGLAKGAAKAVSETITNTSQQVFNSKGELVKAVVTNQNRNK